MRTTNEYGKSDEERAAILRGSWKSTIPAAIGSAFVSRERLALGRSKHERRLRSACSVAGKVLRVTFEFELRDGTPSARPDPFRDPARQTQSAEVTG